MHPAGGKKVYDVTKYLNEHPGGPEIVLDYAGKDADDMFEDIGHSSGAREKLKSLLIGNLKVNSDKYISYCVSNYPDSCSTMLLLPPKRRKQRKPRLVQDQD